MRVTARKQIELFFVVDNAFVFVFRNTLKHWNFFVKHVDRSLQMYIA